MISGSGINAISVRPWPLLVSSDEPPNPQSSLSSVQPSPTIQNQRIERLSPSTDKQRLELEIPNLVSSGPELQVTNNLSSEQLDIQNKNNTGDGQRLVEVVESPICRNTEESLVVGLQSPIRRNTEESEHSTVDNRQESLAPLTSQSTTSPIEDFLNSISVPIPQPILTQTPQRYSAVDLLLSAPQNTNQRHSTRLAKKAAANAGKDAEEIAHDLLL